MAGATTILAQNLSHLPFGPAENWLLGNGIAVTRSYDQDYRLTQLTDTGILSRTLAYDTRNNITGITDNLDASRSQSFGYDALSRLTSGTGHYGTLGWTYDGVGNRLSETRNGVTDNYSYPSTSHRLQSAGAMSLSYDAAGNVIQKGNQTLSYNASGRLTSVTEPPLAQQTQTYSMDGLRRTKTTTLGTSHYLYTSTGNLLAEASGLGVPQVEYIWLEGQPLAMIANGLVNYVHADHLATPQKLTNPAQQTVWDGIYEPFGKVNLFTNLADNNLRFPGQYFDAETGLHQNWNRDYWPEGGRYLQSDSIGLDGGINTFAYGESNPVSKIDPTGKSPIIGGLIMGYVSACAVWAFDRAMDADFSSNCNPDLPPGEDKKRHCYASCLMTKCLLGLPAAMAVGVIKELVDSYIGSAEIDDIRANNVGVGYA